MFWFLVAVGAVLIAINESNKKQKQVDRSLQDRNDEWYRYLAAYRQLAKPGKQKQFLEQILNDVRQQNLVSPGTAAQFAEIENVAEPVSKPVSAEEVEAKQIENWNLAENEPWNEPEMAATSTAEANQIAIDNASLLLYFGAFLLIASVGLFVVFGGALPILRTLATLTLAIILYGGGVWLFHNRPKLRQAGVAFSAVGIVIAPLVGVAVYAYLLHNNYGAAVWFTTSLACLGLYAHALKTFQQPLLGYVLIATFLSLFESGLHMATLPVYYLVWGLALFGIGLRAAHNLKGFWPELQEPSRNSSQLVVPLGIVAGLYLVPTAGILQLGITFVLAAVFYAQEAFATKDEGERAALLLAGHVLGQIAIATTAYGITGRVIATGAVLGVANLLQLLAIATLGRQTSLWRQTGDVVMVTSIAVIALTYGHPRALTAGLMQALVIGAVIWWYQSEAIGYGLAALAWLALIVQVGQMVLMPHLSWEVQSFVSLDALAVLYMAYHFSRNRGQQIVGWMQWTLATFMAGAVLTLLLSAFATPLVCLLITLGVVIVQILFAESTGESELIDFASLFIALPIIRAYGTPQVELAAVAAGLAVSGVLVLRYRRELLRWTNTILWLLLIPALAAATPGTRWSPALYTLGFMAICYILIFYRAVARGVVLASGKIPLTSFARSTSLSYVVGYIVAGFVAFCYSLGADNSRVITSVLVAALILTTLGLTRWIEKRPNGLVVVPFMLQILLWSLIRPVSGDNSLTAFILLSSAAAAACYVVAERFTHAESTVGQYIANCALATSFVAPAWAFTGVTIVPAMPVSLVVSGCVLSYAARWRPLSEREAAGSIITLGVLWLLYVLGVRELQVYVYTVLTTLGIYAYRRTTRGDYAEADSYIWAMLGLSTVPLALQAINGLAGGLYGWLFLVQQVVIMLLGMAIGKSYVTRWGLYAAVAAVLYQLRGLGYAALAVLAIFLIGLAVYELNRHNDAS